MIVFDDMIFILQLKFPLNLFKDETGKKTCQNTGQTKPVFWHILHSVILNHFLGVSSEIVYSYNRLD